MTADEMKQARDVLEAEIFRLLRTFYETTGLVPMTLRIRVAEGLGESPRIVGVSVEVTLP